MQQAVILDNVGMHFRMHKERVENLKDHVIRFMKRQMLDYDDLVALDDISFQVEKGDVFGIVGLNGSGKSTLLKIICGILKPTSGTVRTVGTIAPLIELGAGFDTELTARENIFLNGAVLGYSKRYLEEKFDEIVEFSEMQEFLDMPLKNYSSGMMSRIAFSIATMTRPDILIVDEILGVGDFRFQEKCEARINEMMSGGTTVLFVSHSIEQVERLCKHAVWLEKGKLVMQGVACEVCAAYKEKA